MREAYRVKIDGLRLSMIYTDEAAGLLAKGHATITRASHVEPATAFGWDDDGWLADMRPVKGPLLFAGETNGVKRGFTTRQAALDAERRWLREYMGI